MLIKPHGKYRIVSQDQNNRVHEWNLTIVPEKRAWQLVNRVVKKGDNLNGFRILSVKKIYEPINLESEIGITELPLKITQEDFYNSVAQSSLAYAAAPSYDQSYRCDICGGVVANDVCTSCMFDWDS